MNFGQRAGANLPDDLRKQINATHSRTKAYGPRARREIGKSGKERKKLLKGVGKTYKKPLDLARERKTKNALHVSEKDRYASSSESETEHHVDQGKQRVHSSARHGMGKAAAEPEADSDDATSSDESLPQISRAAKAALEEDDAQIAALEKKLGLKGNKALPKTFHDDGLGELLDGVEGISDRKRKREEYSDFLHSKRTKSSKVTRMNAAPPVSDENSQEGEPKEVVEFGGDDSDGLSSDEGAELSDEFDGFDSEGAEGLPPIKTRENPYRPPVSTRNSEAAATKYVPPSLREPPSSEIEAILRLKRQLQGLLNRLSEANLLSILKEIEKVYSSNPRQHVSSTLIDLLMSLLCDRTSLNDTFIILHAGFIAAVFKVIGEQFGAQLIERLIFNFDKFYADQKTSGSTSKETSNIVALVAEMYTLQVIGSRLMFDFIRFFLDEISDLNTELLLKIIKNCGPQLRKDDPLALKDIVQLLQKSVAKVGVSNLSVRTKFMIETIDNLKNNRQKTGIAASQLASEHIARMKRTLAALNDRNLKATEPLGVGLGDIRSSKKDGKWWLVGASWKTDLSADGSRDSRLKPSNDQQQRDQASLQEDVVANDDVTANLGSLARTLRLNTEVRRAIFHAIMTASDYQDAFTRLTKLRLSATQSQEISRVLLLLAATEEPYNPYYALIARKLCTAARKFRMNFQFGLWGVFRRLGERGLFAEGDEGDQEENGEAVSLRAVVSYAKFFGQLVADGALGLGVLKVLNALLLQPQTKVFLEVMLVTIFTRLVAKQKDERSMEQAVRSIFAELSKNVVFAASLRPFIRDVVAKSEVPRTDKEGKAVKRGVRTADKVLMEIQTGAAVA